MADQEFAEQFIDRFIEETSRHLVEIDDRLMEMRQGGEASLARLHDMIGLFHSIKGNALMMGFEGLCDVCRRMEEILSRCRQRGAELGEVNIDRLHRALALMARWLESPEQLGLALPEGLESLCHELGTSIPPVSLANGGINWDEMLPSNCPLRGETSGNVHRISLRKGYSPADVSAIQDALNAVEEGALRGTVTVDLTGFPTMTSMLIGTLVAMHRRLAQRGQHLAACSPSPSVLALLQSSGINQFIRIYPDFPTTLANEDR